MLGLMVWSNPTQWRMFSCTDKFRCLVFVETEILNVRRVVSDYSTFVTSAYEILVRRARFDAVYPVEINTGLRKVNFCEAKNDRHGLRLK